MAEIERLREENQSLRNLADNLRPGPISQALQDSPDYSGQTIERLRAIIRNAIDHMGEWEYDDMRHWQLDAEAALTDDSSAPETSPHLSAAELLIPATRYYIGRMTIHTTVHAEALARGWHSIPQNVRNVIRTDLEDAFRRDDAMRADPVCSSSYYPLGGDVDREAWEEVRKAWLSEPSAVETSDNPHVVTEYQRGFDDGFRRRGDAEKASGYQTYPGEPLAGIYEAGVGIVRLGKDDEATGE